jgi:formamidopyrimidine-DNA glycosylase
MPELPEVETIRRTLEPLLVGRRIASFHVAKPQVLRSHRPPEAARLLTGRVVTGLSRRGKALLFHLDNDWMLAFHFALWGVVRVGDAATADASTAAVLTFDAGPQLEFRELQLSGFNLCPAHAFDRVPFFAEMGPDPLAPGLTAPRFREILQGRGAIRNLLTDQTRLSGIGNLWAQEILFAAGLRPGRKVETLTAPLWTRLYRSTRSVLNRAVRAGGEPEFTDARGRKGRCRLAVYGRGGQACRVCGTTIASGRVGGRPVSYCPTCQK